MYFEHIQLKKLYTLGSSKKKIKRKKQKKQKPCAKSVEAFRFDAPTAHARENALKML